MAAVTTAINHMVNGNVPAPIQNINEVLEYEKILKLRDEVFAGTHPRLTVPAQARKLVSPAPPPQLNSQQIPNVSPFTSNNTTAAQYSTPTQQTVVSLASSQPATSAVSEINPILLTKSDDLVRAEIQLKRARLEKALRDQFEQKRLDARKRPAPAEAKPDFDISAVLAKALEVEKPIADKDDGPETDSFDENSFYSSKAPDSTPERGAASPSPSQQQVPVQRDDFDADLPLGQRVQSAVMGSPLNPETDNDASPKYLSAVPRNRAAETMVNMSAMDIDDEEEEGEYSPPEAMDQYASPNAGGSQPLQTILDPRSRPLRRYSEADDGGRRAVSPSEARTRINGRMQRDRGRHQQGSPEPGQQYPPRKKRKMDKRGERKSRRNGGLSPDAFIKEENVSPPPFHDVQPLGSGRLRPNAADRPIIIDDGPVQDMRYTNNSDRYVESPGRPLSRHADPMIPMSEPRMISRSVMRPVRDDQDLRRVASMHSMRVEQPREFVDAAYSTPARTETIYREASPAIAQQQPRSFSDNYDRPHLQEIRVPHTPGTMYSDSYQDRIPEYRYEPIMPPPPPQPVERIVVDQYGRKFREIIEPEHGNIVPRAASVRPAEPESSRLEAYRGSRSGSVFVEPLQERRYTQEMLPPQATYRQVVETPRASAIPLTSPARDRYEQVMSRGGNAQVIDRASQQPMYLDDRPEMRQPVRMASVRPAQIRYEEAPLRETVVRGQSMRPVGREGSVFMEDRMQPRREYVPVEQPRYRVVEQEPRYVDAQGREVFPVDGGGDGRPRIVQRY